MGGGHLKLIDDFYTDNKLYSFIRRIIASFLSGFVTSGTQETGILAPEEPGDVWRQRRWSRGGQVWLLKCDYYEIQVKCCIDCLIVCLAHFDNSHNEQQSELKIQGLTTNQSGSCSRKK